MNNNTQNNQTFEEKITQRIVSTPYGRGLVVKTYYTRHLKEELDLDENEDITSDSSDTTRYYEIHLTDWISSINESSSLGTNNNKAKATTLYTTEDYPSVQPKIGDDVLFIPFGRGIITNVIHTDNDKDSSSKTVKYEITLTSWRLASGSRVKCYSFATSKIQVVRKKRLVEMKPPEKIDYALQKKKEASEHFKNKSFGDALRQYALAVDSVRYLSYAGGQKADETHIRSTLLEIMVTCCNNASTCSLKIKNYASCEQYAKNALLLLDALYNKRGMTIHSYLISKKKNLSDEKLFGEWRGKSLLMIAKSLFENEKKQDFTQAIEYLNKAKKECIEPYMTDDPSKQKALAGLKSVQKEVLKLQRSCLLKKKENDKKEKRRAQAMFGSSSNKSKKETSTNNADDSKVVSNEKGHNGKDKNKENGTAPTPVSDETTTKEETPAPAPAPAVTTSSSPRKKSLGRRVSFREDVSFTKKTKADIHGVNDDEEDDDEIPWYEEHKEALILTGLGGALALAMTMLRSSRK